jgi:hypothetical protein
MERVAFLIERTGERIGCLLNPRSLTVQRMGGIRQRQAISGPVSGGWLKDDPLVFTGGGRTELTLDLLFDVTLPGSTIQTQDVRELTRPLWELTERSPFSDGFACYPQVRFVWGKAWNVPGVIATVAERLEHFTMQGEPRRSWLRLKLIRVEESEPSSGGQSVRPPSLGVEEGNVEVFHALVGDERLSDVSNAYYGDSSLWRLIADANGLEDPLHVPAGAVLRIPPKESA